VKPAVSNCILFTAVDCDLPQAIWMTDVVDYRLVNHTLTMTFLVLVNFRSKIHLFWEWDTALLLIPLLVRTQEERPLVAIDYSTPSTCNISL